MIGFIDLDFLSSKEVVPLPNLELMKLTTYYIEELNTRPVFIERLEQLEGYEELHVFSYKLDVKVPPPVLIHPNVVYYGTAKSNQLTYEPLSPSYVELFIPSTKLYKGALQKRKPEDNKAAQAFFHFLEDGYCRLAAGDKPLPPPPLMPNRKVWVYDVDLCAAPEYEETLRRIAEKKPTSIECIYPIHCRSLPQYTSLRQIPKLAEKNKFFLHYSKSISQLKKEITDDYFGLRGVLKPYNTFFVCGELPRGKRSTERFKIDSLKRTLQLLATAWSLGASFGVVYEGEQASEWGQILGKLRLWVAREDVTFSDFLTKKLRKTLKKAADSDNELRRLTTLTKESVLKKGVFL